MSKVLLFAGSNSSKSINKKLVTLASKRINHESQVIDLNDFEAPIYSIDREESSGIPQPIEEFLRIFESASAVVISMAEHNGSYSVAFKNLIDWSSRSNKDFMKGKAMVLMATSPGKRGGKGVLESALNSFPRYGAVVTGSFSLPSFYDNFSDDEGIKDEGLNQEFLSVLAGLEKSI